MRDTFTIIEWIQSLPEFEKSQMKEILLGLNEIRVKDPEGFDQIILKMHAMMKK